MPGVIAVPINFFKEGIMKSILRKSGMYSAALFCIILAAVAFNSPTLQAQGNCADVQLVPNGNPCCFDIEVFNHNIWCEPVCVRITIDPFDGHFHGEAPSATTFIASVTPWEVQWCVDPYPTMFNIGAWQTVGSICIQPNSSPFTVTVEIYDYNSGSWVSPQTFVLSC